jgi:ribosomal protein S18 acetylase RimI-like enzyme
MMWTPNNEPVGVLHYRLRGTEPFNGKTFEEHDRIRYRKDNLQIELLGIHARARGKGLGRKLLKFALAKAMAKPKPGEVPVRTATLDVDDDNHQARALYRSLGFEFYRRNGKDEPNNSGVDSTLMRKVFP